MIPRELSSLYAMDPSDRSDYYGCGGDGLFRLQGSSNTRGKGKVFHAHPYRSK